MYNKKQKEENVGGRSCPVRGKWRPEGWGAGGVQDDFDYG